MQTPYFLGPFAQILLARLARRSADRDQAWELLSAVMESPSMHETSQRAQDNALRAHLLHSELALDAGEKQIATKALERTTALAEMWTPRPYSSMSRRLHDLRAALEPFDAS